MIVPAVAPRPRAARRRITTACQTVAVTGGTRRPRERTTSLTAIGSAPRPILFPELIGREPELAALDSALAGAFAGNGRLVVAGDAGVGKTALLRAFVARVRFAGPRAFVGSALRSRRHALDITDLTDDEVLAFGRLSRRLITAVKAATGAERYTLAMMAGVPHFHTWFIPQAANSSQKAFELLGSKRTSSEGQVIDASARIRTALT